MSTDPNDDTSNLATTVLWGIKSALCCVTPDSATDTVSQTDPVVQRQVEGEKMERESLSLANIATSRLMNVALASMQIRCPNRAAMEVEVEENSEEKLIAPSNNDSLPSHHSLYHKHPNISEIWSPNKRQSDWDMYFESQSDICTGTSHKESGVNTTDNEDEYETDWEEVRRSTYEEDDLTTDYARSKGEVFLSYMSKVGMRCTSISPDTRLEMVAAWLNEGSNHNLPISQNINPDGATFQGKFRKLTISEAFGDRLDTEKQGITIFVGPVNGKMSFQMSVCDLKMLERATTRRSIIFMGEMKKPIEYVT